MPFFSVYAFISKRYFDFRQKLGYWNLSQQMQIDVPQQDIYL